LVRFAWCEVWGSANEMPRDTSCWWAGARVGRVVIRVRGGRFGRSHGSTRGHRSSDTACCPLRGAENHKTQKTFIQFLPLFFLDWKLKKGFRKILA
jgi:hypothetical protein